VSRRRDREGVVPLVVCQRVRYCYRECDGGHPSTGTGRGKEPRGNLPVMLLVVVVEEGRSAVASVGEGGED
jgi:hypothetical protein